MPIGMRYRSHADTEYATFWFEKNLQGDIVAVYSADGTKLISYNYNAWGIPFTKTHVSGTKAYKNPFRYRGYYLDDSLGIYRTQTRLYDPYSGRFVSPDSALYFNHMHGCNMYAYCNNNPVNYYDPTGELFISISAVLLIKGAATILLGTSLGFVLYDVTHDQVIGDILVEATNALRDALSPEEDETSDLGPNAPPSTSEDATPVEDTDALKQGIVTANPNAPPVEAGKQRKHLPGDSNNEGGKSIWNKGENGVRQTQEAWQNSRPKPGRTNVRIGTAKDGRKIEIHFGKKGIHGYPIF